MSPVHEVEEQVDQTAKNQYVPANQQVLDVKGSVDNIPESQMTDTGHPLQQPVAVDSIEHVHIDLDINLSEDQLQITDEQDFTEEDTIVPNPDAVHDEYLSTAIDATSNCITSQVDKPATTPITVDEVKTPIEKVGCIFVTDHLQKYLEEHLQSSDKQAFLDLLFLLDQYFYDNPRQHIYCMLPHNEYITLLNHAIYSHIDISMFPMIRAVLSTRQ